MKHVLSIRLILIVFKSSVAENPDMITFKDNFFFFEIAVGTCPLFQWFFILFYFLRFNNYFLPVGQLECELRKQHFLHGFMMCELWLSRVTTRSCFKISRYSYIISGVQCLNGEKSLRKKLLDGHKISVGTL